MAKLPMRLLGLLLLTVSLGVASCQAVVHTLQAPLTEEAARLQRSVE